LLDYEDAACSHQCDAGVWTDGIGTRPVWCRGKTMATERQAAGNFITNVLRVETALARCVLVNVPQYVYDARVAGVQRRHGHRLQLNHGEVYQSEALARCLLSAAAGYMSKAYLIRGWITAAGGVAWC
jgi:GH24 family phage-related lysozyme (muramidase)